MKVLQNVRAEFSLTALAYNMRRVINILGMRAMLAAAGGEGSAIRAIQDAGTDIQRHGTQPCSNPQRRQANIAMRRQPLTLVLRPSFHAAYTSCATAQQPPVGQGLHRFPIRLLPRSRCITCLLLALVQHLHRLIKRHVER